MATTEARSAGTSPRALQAATLCEAFQITVAERPEQVALRTAGGAVEITFAEYAARVERLAAGLTAVGVGRGDTVAMMLTNRPEFHLVDAAAFHLGATPFSVYNTSSPEQIAYLFSNARNRVVVCERQFAAAMPDVEHLFVVEELDELEAAGDPGFDFEAAWRAVTPDDVLTLIYTSGTTGNPKGVQITHRNIVETVRSYAQIVDFPDGGKIVSYLPMAHVAERNVSHYLPMAFGFTVTCVANPRDVMQAVAQVHPTWFFAVPRIWEKLKSGLEGMLGKLEDEEQKRKILGALEMSMKRVDLIQAGEEVPADLEEQFQQADKELFSNLRAMLGLDQLEACNVGAAPTPPEVIKFFHAIGVPLAELWGMSETTGAGTTNPPEKIKIGTVGPPAPGIEIKLADEDNEILIKGPIVMTGYRNLPDKTKETYTDDGWLRTGDIGEFDEDGYLKIVDRKKELIINAAGKNMSPANIESKLKSAGPLIGQAIAIGDGRRYNVALVTLDPDNLPAFLKEAGVDGDADDLEAVVSNEKVNEAVQTEVDAANEHLARVEQIKKFKILPTEWEPGCDELTPTMKLKRRPIEEKYEKEIEELYEG
jgi:long-chain acyl-CoA synthetase